MAYVSTGGACGWLVGRPARDCASQTARGGGEMDTKSSEGIL